MMAGLWFDELEVGQTFDHAMRRTVTETDNLLFTHADATIPPRCISMPNI